MKILQVFYHLPPEIKILFFLGLNLLLVRMILNVTPKWLTKIITGVTTLSCTYYLLVISGLYNINEGQIIKPISTVALTLFIFIYPTFTDNVLHSSFKKSVEVGKN